MKKQTWTRAACAPQNRAPSLLDLDWFTTDKDEKYKCRAVCQGQCPIRKECIQYALSEKLLHGIWGGVDDYEIRRAMSVDSGGDPSQRSRPPRCPFCKSRDIQIAAQKTKAGYKTTCMECDLWWWMATVPTQVKNRKT